MNGRETSKFERGGGRKPDLDQALDGGISGSNRWGAYNTMRAKWQEHIQQTLFRPVLLIDEAQEMSPPLLAELRLLGSMKLDQLGRLVQAVSCPSQDPELPRSEFWNPQQASCR